MDTNTKPKILIVDDDQHILELLCTYIGHEGYETLTVQDGLQALEVLQAEHENIQAIVSDVSMPNLDGYELCKRVRENENTNNIPLIFVSALTALEEKMKGYQVGGDEYITKPIQPEEVILKVKNIIENKIKHIALNEQLNEAQKVAMQAMSYSGNLGMILQFMQDSLRADSFEVLSKQVFDVTACFGLVCVIQFHSLEATYDFASSGDVSPLECNIIELTRRKGRFFDFGARTTINLNNFSLLVKNMPIDNPEKYGEMKDILGNLCNAIEIRAQTLLFTSKTERKNRTINVVKQALNDIDASFRVTQRSNIAAIENMIQEIEIAMFNFGLTEDQEEQIRGITKQCLNKSDKVFEEGMELNDKFEVINDTLNTALT